MTRAALLALFCAAALPILAAPILAAPADGWTLRAAANSSPVAVLDGPGNLQNLALFCLSGQPFLALVFHQPPKPEALALDFDLAAAGRIHLAARREPSAGDAYLAALRDQPLAQALAGRDTSARLAIDGTAAGTLPLAGSTATIRAALAPCLPL